MKFRYNDLRMSLELLNHRQTLLESLIATEDTN